MVEKVSSKNNKNLLREQAVTKLAEKKSLNSKHSLPGDADNHRLMHELMVHQIELEMQNEELLATKEQTSLALNRFTELFEFAPITYCTVTNSSEIKTINLDGVNQFGIPRLKLIGNRLSAFVSYDYLSIFNEHLDSVFSTNQTAQCELKLNSKSQQSWVQANFKFIQSHNECLIALTDITKRKEAEDELNLAATVYESLNEAVMVTNVNGLIIAINPSFTKLTGYTSKEAIGQNCSLLRSDVHDQQFFKIMWQTLQTEGKWEGEIYNTKKNGEQYIGWLTISTIFDADNKVCKRVGLLTDITEKKQAADLIEAQANFDSLTGLPNRRLFQDRLAKELVFAQRNDTQFALLSIDLDQFKDINDSMGHQTGDELLIEASHRLQKCIRSSDNVSRLGGDEFTVIMGELESLESTKSLAERVLQSLSAPFYLGENIGYVSASIGIVIYPMDGTDTESLIRNADQAMYAAKSDGRNCMRYFTQSMEDQVQKRLSLNTELRSAIGNNEFWIAYQPIVNLHSGQIHKAESLLRWSHPELGNIEPTEFIPIAEESGLIANIGNWVFEHATLQTAKWQKTLCPNFQTSINMSPAQFKEDHSSHLHWINYLNKIKLNSKNVVIEITEGLLMDMSSQVMAQLDSFDTAGIKISLDDFGTGYSSLSYLKKFHIDYLKIDQSFVTNLKPDSENMALCEAIVGLAHKLGLKVIAEGIETIEQRDLLIGVNCDYGQGFLFSTPLLPDEFEEFVLKNNAMSGYKPD